MKIPIILRDDTPTQAEAYDVSRVNVGVSKDALRPIVIICQSPRGSVVNFAVNVETARILRECLDLAIEEKVSR